MNNENAEKDKVIMKTSIITPDALYEMVYDRGAYKTSFLKSESRWNNRRFF
jgi:hypothetical protein